MVRLWDVATGTALQTLKVDVAIRRLSFFRGVHTMRQIENYQLFSLSTLALTSLLLVQPLCKILAEKR